MMMTCILFYFTHLLMGGVDFDNVSDKDDNDDKDNDYDNGDGRGGVLGRQRA